MSTKIKYIYERCSLFVFESLYTAIMRGKLLHSHYDLSVFIAIHRDVLRDIFDGYALAISLHENDDEPTCNTISCMQPSYYIKTWGKNRKLQLFLLSLIEAYGVDISMEFEKASDIYVEFIVMAPFIDVLRCCQFILEKTTFFNPQVHARKTSNHPLVMMAKYLHDMIEIIIRNIDAGACFPINIYDDVSTAERREIAAEKMTGQDFPIRNAINMEKTRLLRWNSLRECEVYGLPTGFKPSKRQKLMLGSMPTYFRRGYNFVAMMKKTADVYAPMKCSHSTSATRDTCGYRLSNRASYHGGTRVLNKRAIGTTNTRVVMGRIESAQNTDLILNRKIDPDPNFVRRGAVLAMFVNLLGEIPLRDLFMLGSVFEMCYRQPAKENPKNVALLNEIDRANAKAVVEEGMGDDEDEIKRKSVDILCKVYERRSLSVGLDMDLVEAREKLALAQTAHEKNVLISIHRPNCLCRVKCTGIVEKTKNCEPGNNSSRKTKREIYESVTKWYNGNVTCPTCRISHTLDDTTSDKSRPLVNGMVPGITACSTDGTTRRLFTEFYGFKKSHDGQSVSHHSTCFFTNASTVVTSTFDPEKAATMGNSLKLCYTGNRTCWLREARTFKNRNPNRNLVSNSEDAADMDKYKGRRWLDYKSPLEKDYNQTWKCQTCSGVSGYNEENHSAWNECIHQGSCIQLILVDAYNKFRKVSNDREKRTNFVDNRLLPLIRDRMCIGCMSVIKCHHFLSGHFRYCRDKSTNGKSVQFATTVCRIVNKVWGMVYE